jgi:hypothetical protein
LPRRRPFILDLALPERVLGPVDFRALRRFDSNRAKVIVGDLRIGIDAIPISLGQLRKASALAFI